jgi:hypothetical protein
MTYNDMETYMIVMEIVWYVVALWVSYKLLFTQPLTSLIVYVTIYLLLYKIGTMGLTVYNVMLSLA